MEADKKDEKGSNVCFGQTKTKLFDLGVEILNLKKH